jgi:hypothetical protein
MARQWIWIKTNRPPKNAASKPVKDRILVQAQRFLNEHYKAHTPPRPKHAQWNYVIDYTVKWRGPYLYFIAKYACPSPRAISPEFEVSFARLGYFGQDRFNLWARRHNDQWLIIDDNLSLEACFKCMEKNPWFEI